MTHRKIGVRSIAIHGGNKNGEIPLLAPLDPFPPPLEFPPRSNSKRSPRSVTNRVFFCDTRQRCTGDPLAAWRSPRASPESSLSFLSSNTNFLLLGRKIGRWTVPFAALETRIISPCLRFFFVFNGVPFHSTLVFEDRDYCF